MERGLRQNGRRLSEGVSKQTTDSLGTRRRRRGLRGNPAVPHGHWKTTTFIGGLRLSGLTAPMVLDGPVNGVWFQAYVDQVLVPTLSPGDVVIMGQSGQPQRGASASQH